MTLLLTADDRRELIRRARSRKSRANEDVPTRPGDPPAGWWRVVRDGHGTVGCYPDYVSRWKQRFEADRVAGLRAKYAADSRKT
jgi:hypothetical protein